MTCNNDEIIRLCQGLSVLLRAGIGLSEGLFLQAETESGELQVLVRKLAAELDLGESLAAAMENSMAFPRHVTGMIRIGEQTGRLEEALESLADFYEDRRRIAVQIRQALTYPSLVLLLMLAVIGVLLVAVLPVFDSVYASLGSRLTGISAGLLHLGEMLKAALPVLLLLLIVLVGAVLWIGRSERLLTALRLWVRSRFGDRGILRAYNNAQFAQALSMGLRSGLPMEDALELSGQLLTDTPGAAARCRDCLRALLEGTALAEAMGNAGFLTPVQSRMLTLGIRGGNADQVMGKLADTLMEEAGERLERMVSGIEPTMVLAASLLVGTILLSVMLPLLNILSAIG